MHKKNKIIATCLVFFMLSGPALAARSLIPPDTNFQLVGKVMLSETNINENCNIAMVGTTSPTGTKGVAAKITGVTVTSKTRQCSTLSFTNFPYDVVIKSHTDGVVQNLIFIVKGHACEFPPIPVTISKKGLWSFHTTGICDFVGALQSNPPVTIDK